MALRPPLTLLQRQLWTPARLPTRPVFWFDARYGCAVDNWVNQGSLGGSIAQATGGSQPAVNLVGVKGKPSVNFATSKFYGPLTASGPAVTDWTIFAFGKFNASVKAICGWGWTDTQAGFAVYTDQVVGNDTGTYTPSGSWDASSIRDGNPHSQLCVFGASSAQAFLDGASVSVTTNNRAKGTITSRNFVIGSSDGLTEFGDQPGLAILLIYPGIMTARDINRTIAWAHWGYEYENLLPASNPYANVPPLIGT